MLRGSAHAIWLIALPFLLTIENASADRDLKEELLSSSVLVGIVAGPDTGSASGFLLGLRNQEFFVTARHVLFDSVKGTSAQTQWALKGTEVNLRIYSGNPDSGRTATITVDLQVALRRGGILLHPTQDVAIVHLGHRETEDSEDIIFAPEVSMRAAEPLSFSELPPSAIKRFRDVIVGNSTFIFGYPSSIGLKNLPQIEPLKPLLRRGVIAGKNMQEQTLILDCPVYYGNSGGPVIEVEYMPNGVRYRIVGVVSEFVPFAEKWVVTHTSSNVEVSNSGYSIAVPIDFVIELMEMFNNHWSPNDME
jgi:hypothetical protein